LGDGEPEERPLGQVVGPRSVAGEQVKRLEEPLVVGEEELLEHRGLADSGTALRSVGSIITLHERLRIAPRSVLPTASTAGWSCAAGSPCAQCPGLLQVQLQARGSQLETHSAPS